MEHIDSFKSAIKSEISKRILDCECRYLGVLRKVINSANPHKIKLYFDEGFDLPNIQIVNPLTINVEFTDLVYFDIDGKERQRAYASGIFGPITISQDSSVNVIDTSKAVISGLFTD